jgi:hypothetical protein
VGKNQRWYYWKESIQLNYINYNPLSPHLALEKGQNIREISIFGLKVDSFIDFIWFHLLLIKIALSCFSSLGKIPLKWSKFQIATIISSSSVQCSLGVKKKALTGQIACILINPFFSGNHSF